MLKIDDFNELSALNKTILAAKFSTYPDPGCREMTASPILAGLSNRVYDELGKHKANKVIGADAYEELRRVKTSQGFRAQWRPAVMVALNDSFFVTASHEDRIRSAKAYLSPFTCTEEELELFLEEVEKRRDGRQSIDKLFKDNDLTGARFFDRSYNYLVSGGEARLVLGKKKGGNCDIFFSGVQTFRISSDGSVAPEDSLLSLKKHMVSSGTLQKIDATFENEEKKKLHIVIEADTVNYWF